MVVLCCCCCFVGIRGFLCIDTCTFVFSSQLSLVRLCKSSEDLVFAPYFLEEYALDGYFHCLRTVPKAWANEVSRSTTAEAISTTPVRIWFLVISVSFAMWAFTVSIVAWAVAASGIVLLVGTGVLEFISPRALQTFGCRTAVSVASCSNALSLTSLVPRL